MEAPRARLAPERAGDAAQGSGTGKREPQAWSTTLVRPRPEAPSRRLTLRGSPSPSIVPSTIVGARGSATFAERQPAGGRCLLLPTGWRPARGRPVQRQQGGRILVP